VSEEAAFGTAVDSAAESAAVESVAAGFVVAVAVSKPDQLAGTAPALGSWGQEGTPGGWLSQKDCCCLRMAAYDWVGVRGCYHQRPCC
jgi:hypothetical protein